jgi:WS/DGAT/MGAT family acyltransferase
MQRLSGTDAGFLYGETTAWHMHAGAVVLLDPLDASAGFGVDSLRDLIRSRLPRLGLFRYRVAGAPLGVARPSWIEVPDLDLDVHVRTASLPPPGGLRELSAFAAAVLSRKLARERPLWEMWVVDALEDGRFALVVKIHHACVDGVRGAQLYDVIFDLERGAPLEREVVPRSASEPAPSWAALARGNVADVARLPVRLGRALGAIAGAGVRLARFARSPARRHITMPFTAPLSPFNGRLTAARSVALCSIPIEEVRAVVRRSQDVTFNDVVLAACTGALRRYLLAAGAPPSRPLVAQVPIGVHQNVARADTSAMPGNFVSAMGSLLPVQLSDPLEQLRAVVESTRAAKQMQQEVLGEDFLADLVNAAPPALISWLVRAYSASHIERLHPPIFNVLVSNVRGSAVPVYSAGARLVATYPLGPLLAGCGLNVTVLSYVDRLDVGLVACPDIVDDVWRIADALPAALADLVSAGGGVS